MDKLLIVDSGYYYAGSIWIKKGKGWKCIKAAPIIRWFIGKDNNTIKQYLLKKNFKYHWI